MATLHPHVRPHAVPTALAALAALATGCSAGPVALRSSTLDLTPLGPWTEPAADGPSLRGLSVVSEDVVWVSGEDGTCLRSVDGGASWDVRSLPGGGADLRSLHAFDAERALAVSTTDPAVIWRTADGGRTWSEVYRAADPAVFLDGIAFARGGPAVGDGAEHGVVFGDPVGGRFFVLATRDGGRTWSRLDVEAEPLPGEAGFAASGRCIAWPAPDRFVFVTGGAAAARCVGLRLDGEAGATVARLPLRAGRPSRGAFAVAFRDAAHGVAVGGDYLEPEARPDTAAWTRDGGRTWEAADHVPPLGYRSCVTHAAGTAWIACGPNGLDVSFDDGRTWQAAPTPPEAAGWARGLHALQWAAGRSVGFASGAGGRIVRLRWPSWNDRDDRER